MVTKNPLISRFIYEKTKTSSRPKPFFRRIIVPGKRVSLPSELTLASVYMRIRLTPALQVPTVLVNALIA